jgi:hypothetical protein
VRDGVASAGERFAEAFTWPARDPKWPIRLAITAAILLIPILGAIYALGWMLATLDRLRAGDETLPPARLAYLGRGARLFAVQLVYGVGVTVIAVVIYLPGLLLSIHQGQGTANGALLAAAVLLNLLALGVATIGGLLLTFASPAIVLATDGGGITGGLRLREVWRASRVNLANTLIAGLMLVAAGFVGSLGAIVCVVGVLFTTAYSLAMQAWIFRCFETGVTGSTPGPVVSRGALGRS